MEFQQNSFSGGLNLAVDDTRMSVNLKYAEGPTPFNMSYNQYRIGFNVRSRFDVLQNIPNPVNMKLPAGVVKLQAVVTFGTYLILFADGKAWSQQDGTNTWIPVPNFSMSSTVDRLHIEPVPATTNIQGRSAGIVQFGEASE